MSTVGAIVVNCAMALLKEQGQHPKHCYHCNYLLNGMEKEGDVLLIHDESCPICSATNLVELFNRELKQSALN
jgi:hypothetical protein